MSVVTGRPCDAPFGSASRAAVGVFVDHRARSGRPARARPPGRAQQAGPVEWAGESDDKLSYIRAAEGGALIP